MSQASGSWLERFFEIEQYDTDTRTEVLAGLTTFLTMSYIIVVNPAILSAAIDIPGYTDAQVFQMLAIATILASFVAIMVMAFWAKRPFGLAPGMGLNAFFAFTVVIGMGIPWQTALAAVFVEGVIFIIITAVGARRWIIEMFPEPVKFSVGAGIGAFLLFIGLQEMQLVVAYEPTAVTLGNIAQNAWAVLGLVGLTLTLMLYARGVTGSIVIGIVTTAILGWLVWLLNLAPATSVLPPEVIGEDGEVTFEGLQPFFDITPLVGAFIDGLADVEPITFALVVFTFFFVDFFDTAGVLIGLGNQAGLADEQGDLPEMEKPLMADAIGTTFGSMIGTSTVTTYIESATGIEEGGKTGLTALVIGVLFLLAIVAVPIIAAIPDYAIFLAVVIVGLIMLKGLVDFDWNDPAFLIAGGLTIFVQPLTFSIANGIAAGIIAYPLVKFAMGEADDTHPAHWGLAIAFVIYFWVTTSGVVG